MKRPWKNPARVRFPSSLLGNWSLSQKFSRLLTKSNLRVKRGSGKMAEVNTTA